MINKNLILPYGDTLNDGRVQVSFTLPISKGELAMQASREVGVSMGLKQVEVVHMEKVDEGFTFFVIYGSLNNPVDLGKIKIKDEKKKSLTKDEIEEYITNKIGRDIVVVGATTGTDAHTVGIDAIMNMKGFAGHYGLERYKGITTYNLGSQVDNEDFIRFAKKVNADVLLVSQTVTQKNVHVNNLVNLVELLEAEKMRHKVILIVGGARITRELAKELGYDAGFGFGSFAEDVATYFIEELFNRTQES
ncbi:MAG: OAM dimerization domain-containing protein [Bacilli bacterium]|jgi:beta-lysine 5,6-aminomutase beta subunit|nr:OAM dimerization domain-containing protein [Bacilli bacterium]MDD2681719.1 OAM dimerization domain-containing protein [Bacilli bacterium]MDD4063648.1 OAM dimerization domain-containing protein [Bacilli bacterium]MDD5183438.1 OAM dimerization domain-containing protein [Bacilli bacterium]